MNQLSRVKVSFVAVSIIFCLINVSHGEHKENELKDALKNRSNSKLKNNQSGNSNNSAQNNGDDDNNNALKVEAQKMLKLCGVERHDSSNSDNNRNNNNNRNWNSNNGNGQDKGGYGNRNDYYGNSNNNNYNRYGQEKDDNEGSQSNHDNGEWSTYGSQSWNGHQNGNDENSYTTKRNQQSNYGQSNSNANRYGNSNMGDQNGYGYQNNLNGGRTGNRNQNGRPNYGYGNGYGQTTQENSMYGSDNNQQGYEFRSPNRGYQTSSTNNYDIRSFYDPNRGNNKDVLPNDDCGDNGGKGYGSNTFGYNTGMTFGFNKPQHRHRRFNYFNRDENESKENTQCVSQCVFGYLHLLDEDRTPSETMLIKWMQEHVTGNDMDRIKALRDARRCFARLTTTDIEDGCDFSQELSKCLELDLE